jgi:hypothetical protein
MVDNISKQMAFKNLSTGVTTGGITSFDCVACIDLKGYDSVLLGCALGAMVATAVAKLHLRIAADTSAASFVNSTQYWAGTTNATTELNNTLLLLDIQNPLPSTAYRYASAGMDLATANTITESIWAIAYNKHGCEPIVNETTGSSGSGMYYASDVTFCSNPTTSG